LLVTLATVVVIVAGCTLFRSPNPSTIADRVAFYYCDAENENEDAQASASLLKSDIASHAWTDATTHTKDVNDHVTKALERAGNISAGDRQAVDQPMKDWFAAVDGWTQSLRTAGNIAGEGLSGSTSAATLTSITDAIDAGATASSGIQAKKTAAGVGC
jgi:hypothetical protein